MSEIEKDVTAVTGKPLASYERYVELLSHVMGNGLALAADREFLLSLDQSLPLYEAVRPHVREAIRWRFAFDIDELEASRPASRATREVTTDDLIETTAGLALADAAWQEGASTMLRSVNEHESRLWTKPVSPYSAPLLKRLADIRERSE